MICCILLPRVFLLRIYGQNILNILNCVKIYLEASSLTISLVI